MKYLNADVARIIDANLNRAKEGLRVLEEIARMMFDNDAVSSQIKRIRHDISSAVISLGIDKDLIRFRNSENDVFRSGNTTTEDTRKDISSLVRANAVRAQEAVRAMEEFIKLSSPGASALFKSIRFRLYDCEKVLYEMVVKKEKLSQGFGGLFLVVVFAKEGLDPVQIATKCIEKGASVVGCTVNGLTDRAFLDYSYGIVESARNNKVNSIVMDRTDIALASGADGVHLRDGGLSLTDCHAIAGIGLIYGTNYRYGEIAEGFDYIFVKNSESANEFGGVAFLEVRDIASYEAGQIHLRGIQGFAAYIVAENAEESLSRTEPLLKMTRKLRNSPGNPYTDLK